MSVNILIVSGGGGGGASSIGGGGGGGGNVILYESARNTRCNISSGTTLNVTVGAGGAGGQWQNSIRASNGNPSSITVSSGSIKNSNGTAPLLVASINGLTATSYNVWYGGAGGGGGGTSLRTNSSATLPFSGASGGTNSDGSKAGGSGGGVTGTTGTRIWSRSTGGGGGGIDGQNASSTNGIQSSNIDPFPIAVYTFSGGLGTLCNFNNKIYGTGGSGIYYNAVTANGGGNGISNTGNGGDGGVNVNGGRGGSGVVIICLIVPS